MKLRSLRVHGFKSFADSTEISFHEGITAIVGPNGCGKSNISDAIRWVLGEQRPTAIRGAKMEEAIFQGTVNRRPVNRGSVTMTVSNEDGSLPVAFGEVEIGRHVYRDGGSDYSINRSVVRLKDVVDLVRDTGLGANAYSVIENRMIDALLSDRTDERRALFEEAAGIGKYKDRRKAASRKLERAEMDLQRLEDVLAEVETKVRSLARQKGKAERYLELRARRLSVEVAVVGHQLRALGLRLEELEKTLAGEQQTNEGRVAEVRTAEARYEALRIEEVGVERERAAAAAALDEVRSELVRWERDLAVAQERASHADRRLGEIDGERSAAAERRDARTAEGDALAVEAGTLEAELAAARTEVEAAERKASEVRARLADARRALDQIETRERELSRRAAQLEGDAEAAAAQAAELGRRLDRLSSEADAASAALTDIATQGDLFSNRLDVLTTAVSDAQRVVAAHAERLEHERQELDVARAKEMELGAAASAIAGHVSALETMERDQEGLEPAVRGALALGRPGVHGVLADALQAPSSLGRAVEGYLGTLLRGLVVQDSQVARGLQEWFEREWKGGGGLVLLPLDRVPAARNGGSLLQQIDAVGPGAPWVRVLLGDVDLVDGAALFEQDATVRVRLSSAGASTDATGVVRIGNPQGATGILERKERLRALRADSDVAAEAARVARRARDQAQGRVQSADAALEAARTALREAEDAHRRGRAEVAESVDRKQRMDRHKEELARQIEGTKAARSRALERSEAAKRERAALDTEDEQLRSARQSARAKLDQVQEEWDAARTEESRLTVDVARLEGQTARLAERLQAARTGAREAVARLDQLDVEERRLRTDLDAARELRARGEAATAELFQRRSEGEQTLRDKDQVVEAVRESLREAERKARDARAAERDAADLRHRLELERQDTRARIERIQERLEGEWGRSLDALMQEAAPIEEPFDPQALEQELKDLVIQIEKIGPVNMLAVEEHAEESERLRFLKEQHQDLVKAREDLRAAIRQINQTATELFLGTFQQIRENFRAVHLRLFEGGEADIWLGEDEDPLESPIEIHASPRGKKTQRIDLLSGGERALTALSLLFGIYLVKPSPFCVLDEVDAPLDENNIGRFLRLLDEFKRQTQFVVITHNPRTIESADWIYGVTMEEPGVSTIVGVRLEQALEQARGTAAVSA
jgi:chromosome segregation protein